MLVVRVGVVGPRRAASKVVLARGRYESRDCAALIAQPSNLRYSAQAKRFEDRRRCRSARYTRKTGSWPDVQFCASTMADRVRSLKLMLTTPASAEGFHVSHAAGKCMTVHRYMFTSLQRLLEPHPFPRDLYGGLVHTHPSSTACPLNLTPPLSPVSLYTIPLTSAFSTRKPFTASSFCSTGTYPTARKYWN